MSSETPPGTLRGPATLPICIDTSNKSWSSYNGGVDSRGSSGGNYHPKSEGGLLSPICADSSSSSNGVNAVSTPSTSPPGVNMLCSSPTSSPSSAISPKIRNKFIPSDPHQECVVCHGSASGKHFGAYTCESCKLFFLRILKMRNGGRPLVCGNSNKCQVTVNTRSMCRACRFRKCCDAGMAREKCVYGRNARLIVPSTGNSTPVTPGASIISTASGADGSSFSVPMRHLEQISKSSPHLSHSHSQGGDTTFRGPPNNFTFSIGGINTQHPSHPLVSLSSAPSPGSHPFRGLNGGPVVQSIPAVIKSYKSNQNVQLYKATSLATSSGGRPSLPRDVPMPTAPITCGGAPTTPYLTSPSGQHSSNSKNSPGHGNDSNNINNSICQSAPAKLETLPSLIPHQIVPLPSRPPPPLVIPEAPHSSLSSVNREVVSSNNSAISIPSLIPYHKSVSVSSNSSNEPTGPLRRPPESEKNSPKSENSDDSGCYQTDSSLEESERRSAKRMRSNEMGGRLGRPTVHNQSSDSGLSTSRQSEDSSSGEDSPSFMDELDVKSTEHNKSLVNVYLRRDIDKDFFPELPLFSEVVSGDSTLIRPFVATHQPNELPLAVILTKLSVEENVRLENWIDIFQDFGANWMPKLSEQLEQFTPKNRLHISLLEFDCQFLLSTFIPKNISFQPLVRSNDISAEALKPILFGSLFGLNLPVHHVVCRSESHVPGVVNNMLKVECRVMKTLKLLDLSELELAIITNYLALKTFGRHLPWLCAADMRREEAFMDNIFITVMALNKRQKIIRATHLVCEFLLSKSDVFFNFLQCGADQVC